MTKTVLITGASTGIGRATAQLFQQQGWNVVATMRSPEKSPELANLPNVLCLPLDVTQVETISAAIDRAIAQFGTIDVVINNAGYALIGAFEACEMADIRAQFETNVFGLMEVTRAILPHFRLRQQGILVNVASVGGRMAFPIYSPYHGTKWAVEGFSESLQYELRQFNIKVKIIEPGPIKTDFYSRSISVAKKAGLTVYDEYINRTLPKMDEAGSKGSPPEVTAQAIYRAATDGTWKLRYPAGGNAGFMLGLRKLLPDAWFIGIMRRGIE
ncbi:SDR family oxidoreductase [Chamaesiphon polymorphus]|uniref:Short-chain dehydrogenase/reductase n=1 Tax=Chamaesiphon polymorphus CCALA 037 TaxID=2107692 RepID=A0A2T1FVI7_9CYAN|nr:SDR family oxidoreductase [Chamaesiphon polymorphus]PSB48997.1 short-chain dehydrogenase/reductase [Chamaesiphon polymorphus CCALA 037]